MISSTPGVPPIVSDKLCIVYDSRTGDIVHIHRVTTLEGAKIPSEESIAASALQRAETILQRLQGRPLKTTFSKPENFHPGSFHKIDLNTYKLIAIPREEQMFSPKIGKTDKTASHNTD